MSELPTTPLPQSTPAPTTDTPLPQTTPTITTVDDPADPRLDDFRNLNHSDRRPDMPGGKGLVIAEGPLVIPRLLASRFPVRALMGTAAKVESFWAADPSAAAMVARQGIPVFVVEQQVMDAVVGFNMHRGLLASADRVAEPSVEDVLDNLAQHSPVAPRGTVVVLEGVGDHENIGAIFRNAAGLGVDAVLFGAGCADPLYRRAVRVSMGHVLRIPFAHFDGGRSDWQYRLEALKQRGYRVVSLTPNPQAVTLREALDGAEKVAFLVGAEGPGLTEHAMRATDVRARIPMCDGTDSLNVATAAAMAFYERAR